VFQPVYLDLPFAPQGLRGYRTALPPVPEDTADRAARRLAAEQQKEKKDEEKR
jgi:hypothetical protein